MSASARNTSSPVSGAGAELGRMPCENRVPAFTRLKLSLLLLSYGVNSYFLFVLDPRQQPVKDTAGRRQQPIVVAERRPQTSQYPFDATRFGRLHPAYIQVMHQGTDSPYRRLLEAEARQQHFKSDFSAHVRERCPVEVEAQGIRRTCGRSCQPDEARLLIDVAPNQPCARQPVRPGTRPCGPHAPAIAGGIQTRDRAVHWRSEE